MIAIFKIYNLKLHDNSFEIKCNLSHYIYRGMLKKICWWDTRSYGHIHVEMCHVYGDLSVDDDLLKIGIRGLLEIYENRI